MKTNFQTKQTTENEVSLTSNQVTLENIENLILNIRDKQVMLDRDLARLYGVETKVLNQAVKRNIERFPERFMFQITENEKIKVVTNCDHLKDLRFSYQNPYVFTEQGVSMLSAVLKSDIAINTSIMIMDAFVAMRHSISSNQQIINRFENIEHHQLLMIERQDKTETQIEKIFKTLAKYKLPTEGVFCNGQIFDAYAFVTNSLVLIDNYIDESVLLMLSKRNVGVRADIYTFPISDALKLDLQKHNRQYPPINIHKHSTSHDRFLIIDNTEVYHIGASLKDLGKKLFAFSKLNINPNAIL